jgi:hypothetical protein
MEFLFHKRLRGEMPTPETLKTKKTTDTYVEFQYFEVNDVDSTAIIVAIFDKEKLVKLYSNFAAPEFYEELEDVDLSDAEAVIDSKIWSNQESVFWFPDVDTAKAVIESADEYKELSEADFKQWEDLNLI